MVGYTMAAAETEHRVITKHEGPRPGRLSNIASKRRPSLAKTTVDTCIGNSEPRLITLAYHLRQQYVWSAH